MDSSKYVLILLCSLVILCLLLGATPVSIDVQAFSRVGAMPSSHYGVVIRGGMETTPRALSAPEVPVQRFPARVKTSLSPTGHIAFESDRNGANFDLFGQDADGNRTAQLLLASPANDLTPQWSPDGRQLLFASDRDGDYEIYVLTTDGHEVQLTHNTAQDAHPTWDASGTHVIFASNRDNGFFKLYSMAVDGGQIQLLAATPDQHLLSPDVGPDGRIVFMQANTLQPICLWDWDVWIMDADGRNRRRLTLNLGGDLYPRWSPGGAYVVYGACKNFIDADLWAMDPDSGEEFQLNEWYLSNEWGAVFSPDGNYMAFNTDVEGDIEIYISDLNQGIASNLTRHTANDLAASWTDKTATPINRPPNVPSAPFPPNGASDVEGFITLQWEGGDPDWEDVVTYDVYHGAVNPPPLQQSGLTNPEYTTVALAGDNYWRVVAHDNHGATSSGPVWYFSSLPSDNVIMGRITNGITGQPVPDVLVLAGHEHLATSDDRGLYVLSDLPAGTYSLTLLKQGWTFAPDPLVNSEHYQSLVVTVPPGKTGADFKAYDKEPVVFVHGWQGKFPAAPCSDNTIRLFFGADEYFESIDEKLQDAGYYVSYATLATWKCWTPTLSENANYLKTAINRAKAATGRDKVILLAHSMGGLVSRAYIESDWYALPENRDVSKLITFGSPHLGVPVEALLHGLGAGFNKWGLQKYCDEFGPAVCEFSSSGMKAFNETHHYRNEPGLRVEYYLVSGAVDEDNIKDLLVRAFAHILPGNDDGAVQQLSGTGLQGSMYRLKTDEAHGSSVGQPNYFSDRDGHGSLSFEHCIKPLLIQTEPNTTCGSKSDISAQETISPTQASLSPFFSAILHAHETITNTVPIGSGDLFVSTQWLSGTVTTTLLSPEGIVVTPADASNKGSVHYQEDDISSIYLIEEAEAGDWLIVTNGGADIGDNGTNVVTQAIYNSGFRLEVYADKPWYQPGETATVTATIDPPPASAMITATILTGQEIPIIISLQNQSAGIYNGQFMIPDASGYADARFEARIIDEVGHRLVQARQLLLQISPHSVRLSSHYEEIPTYISPEYMSGIQISVGITVTTPATITLSGSLVAADSSFIARSIIDRAVNYNDRNVTLFFPAHAFLHAQKNGPYTLTDVVLVDNTRGIVMLNEANHVYQTDVYDYRHFDNGLLFLPTVMQAHAFPK